MVKIHWITHACFKITTEDNKVIYTDPYQIKAPDDSADIILVSHSHYDHFEENSVQKIFKQDTKLICPKTIVTELKRFNPTGLDPDQSIDIGNIRISAVPAYTPNKQFHPKGNKWVGFIIETGGKRIYHAGDTDLIPEMKNLGKLDIALIPVGGTYTMDFQEATTCCGIIKASVIVPMHDWNKDLNQFKEMVSKAISSVKVEILKGKDLEI